MMGTRESLRGGHEHQCLTRWRRYLRKRPGRFTSAKAAFWRRTRKAYRLRARADAAEIVGAKQPASPGFGPH
jgi:hypothetical protein